MAESQHQPGSVPRNRRAIATWSLAGFGVALLLTGLILSLFTNTPVQWRILLFVIGFMGLLYAAFVWVRLSD
jgi:4-hydroxybenzoate polyprenyltransferase